MQVQCHYDLIGTSDKSKRHLRVLTDSCDKKASVHAGSETEDRLQDRGGWIPSIHLATISIIYEAIGNKRTIVNKYAGCTICLLQCYHCQ